MKPISRPISYLMYHISYLISRPPCFLLILLLLSTSLSAKDPVDYVNPYIGSIGHLLTATTPDVQLPRGMIRLYPRTTPGIRDIYLADKIFGYTMSSMSADFSVTGPCLTALMGEPNSDPAKNASLFDHESETATPYYYSVLQQDNNIHAEYTPAEHAAFYRFTFPKSDKATLLLSVFQDAEMKIRDNNVIEGSQHTGRTGD